MRADGQLHHPAIIRNEMNLFARTQPGTNANADFCEDESFYDSTPLLQDGTTVWVASEKMTSAQLGSGCSKAIVKAMTADTPSRIAV